MPPAIIGIVGPLPLTIGFVSTVTGGDHLLIGNGGHIRAKGKADLAGVGFISKAVAFYGHFHGVGPEIHLGFTQPLFPADDLDIVPAIPHDNAIQWCAINIQHRNINRVVAFGTATVLGQGP